MLDAIRRCGVYQGKLLKEKGGMGSSLKGLTKALFGFFAQKVFEMKKLRFFVIMLCAVIGESAPVLVQSWIFRIPSLKEGKPAN